MKQWKIKRFDELSVQELYEINRRRCEVFIHEQKIICEEELDGIDDKCIHVFLEENKRVIAYCRIVPSGINYENISIGRVLVAKDHRKHGLAREMINITINYIKETLMETKVVLSSQLYVKELYESVGFSIYSQIYEEAGIPHVKMYREI